jgi:Spy/CpxP family protein refolding chaperone
MKKTLNAGLALVLGMAMAGFAGAQTNGQSGDQQGPPPQQDGMREGRGPGGPGRGMPSPEQRLKRMTEALNLTSDQQAKIKTIMESEKTKMDALRDDTSVEGEAKRDKAMQIRKDSQASIREVLTADQQAKFDKMQAEMRNRGSRGPHPDGEKPQNPPPPPPAA